MKKKNIICLLLILFIFIILNNVKNIKVNNSDETLTNQFEAKISMLTKQEGGRHTPFFTGYQTKFKFKDNNLDGVIILPENVEMVMPGDQLTVKIELEKKINLKQTEKFKIYDNDRFIGTGTIVKIEGK